MHHQSARDLFDFYALEDKGDGYIAYLYLKHLDHFVKHAYELVGLPHREVPDPPGETVDEILQAYVQQVGLAAPSRETNIYHGKVMTLKDALKLVTQKEGVNLPVSDKVVPYKIARDVILENPEAIALGTCACRRVAENPCLPAPQEVCLVLGEPFASFIDHHNSMFRKVSQQEAVEVIEAAHERGEVHTGYFKKELGNRLYALCNCCSCCCLGMKMWNLLDGTIPFLAPSGYLSRVGDDCDGCGTCAEEGACPFKAIRMDDDSGRAVIDEDKCMGCGVCESLCPAGALKLHKEPSKGEPLDIEALKRELSSNSPV
jgi:ferredoxin